MSDELHDPHLFDLTGMKESDARDYILSMAAHLKQTEDQIGSLDEEITLWRGRVDLAADRGLTPLREQTQLKVQELIDKKTLLETEAGEFRSGVERMKKQLPLLASLKRNVNTAALQENLDKIAGPLDQVTPALRDAQAEEALAALKKKMAGN